MSETYCSWVQPQHARRLLYVFFPVSEYNLLMVLGKVHDLNIYNKAKLITCKLTFSITYCGRPVYWFSTETAAKVLTCLDLKFIWLFVSYGICMMLFWVKTN
ncbi:hypothetical protein SORBI_3004G096600 [Sorghum bicolor]|uniref:Uncharacterized protein n=2 Tax=Sorghum bicolor TaxID=4558 RepID=A0A194YNN5_SORBI|nr:hypothetical protein SORBI_3004G096600 [Sorghum bicolor]